jgi:hypothetical protein
MFSRQPVANDDVFSRPPARAPGSVQAPGRAAKAVGANAGSLTIRTTQGELAIGETSGQTYDLSDPCGICNARPGEQCASIVNASHTREVPHHTRLKPVAR